MGFPNGRYCSATSQILAILGCGVKLGDVLKWLGISLGEYKKYCLDDAGYGKEVERRQVDLKIKAIDVVGRMINAKDKETAKWYLERSYPDEYQSKQKVDLREVKESVEEVSARKERLRRVLSGIGRGK